MPGTLGAPLCGTGLFVDDVAAFRTEAVTGREDGLFAGMIEPPLPSDGAGIQP